MELQAQYRTAYEFGDVGSTGVLADPRLAPLQPIQVHRWGIVARVAITSATLQLQKGQIGGTPAQFGNDFVTGALAQGKGAFRDLEYPEVVIPGQEVVLNVSVADAGAGDAAFFVQYRPIGFNDVGAVRKGASFPLQITTPPLGGGRIEFTDTRIIEDRLGNLTEVTS